MRGRVLLLGQFEEQREAVPCFERLTGLLVDKDIDAVQLQKKPQRKSEVLWLLLKLQPPRVVLLGSAIGKLLSFQGEGLSTGYVMGMTALLVPCPAGQREAWSNPEFRSRARCTIRRFVGSPCTCGASEGG